MNNRQKYMDYIRYLSQKNEFKLEKIDNEELLKFLLTEKEVNNIFSIPANTLRASRRTGLLWGVKSPKFLKIGSKTVRYRVSDILDWLNQFSTYSNTAQINY